VLVFWFRWDSSKSLAEGINLAFELFSMSEDCAFNQVLDGRAFHRRVEVHGLSCLFSSVARYPHSGEIVSCEGGFSVFIDGQLTFS
jgi:hypothetical protein